MSSALYQHGDLGECATLYLKLQTTQFPNLPMATLLAQFYNNNNNNNNNNDESGSPLPEERIRVEYMSVSHYRPLYPIALQY